MNVEKPNTQQFLDENQAYFEHADLLSGEIEEQNRLYAELIESGQVTIRPFQDAAADYLTSEQARAFGDLRVVAETAPYEEIAAMEAELRGSISDIDSQLAAVEARQTEDAAIIQREKDLVAERIPKLASKLSEIALALEQDIIAKEKSRLEGERIDLEVEYEALSGVYEIAGKPWPIPRLIDIRQLQPVIDTVALEALEEPEDLVMVDDFPEEVRLTSEQVAERVRRKYPDEVLKDASEFLGLLLAEVPKHIYTVEEIADVLYGLDLEGRTNRVSALISAFELGKTGCIGDALGRSGLVFQRGQRRSFRRETGERCGRSQPVFRAIASNEAENKERIVWSDEELDWVYDGWHTVVFAGKATPEYGSYVYTAAREEKPAEILDEEIPEFAEEPEEDQAGFVGNEPSQHVPLASEAAVHESTTESEATWKQKFEDAVTEVIAQFESEGLMEGTEISWKLVRIKSASSTLGTETMAQRAIRNRIITKSEAKNTESLPVEKFICMALQNSHPHIFSHRNRRKQALEIVERAVEGYFEQAEA